MPHPSVVTRWEEWGRFGSPAWGRFEEKKLSGPQAKNWKKETIIGAVISGIWLLVFSGLLIYRFDSAMNMELNAWGDFLAGFSAPLALLWLVIGYIQQGRELSLNTTALLSQQQELQKQVEETARLAESSSRQASAAEQMAASTMDEARISKAKQRSASFPVLRIHSGNNDRGYLNSTIKNCGGDIRNVFVMTSRNYKINLSRGDQWLNGELADIIFTGEMEYPFDFEVGFTTVLEEHHVIKYRMKNPNIFTRIN